MNVCIPKSVCLSVCMAAIVCLLDSVFSLHLQDKFHTLELIGSFPALFLSV